MRNQVLFLALLMMKIALCDSTSFRAINMEFKCEAKVICFIYLNKNNSFAYESCLILRVAFSGYENHMLDAIRKRQR